MAPRNNVQYSRRLDLPIRRGTLGGHVTCSRHRLDSGHVQSSDAHAAGTSHCSNVAHELSLVTCGNLCQMEVVH